MFVCMRFIWDSVLFGWVLLKLVKVNFFKGVKGVGMNGYGYVV